MSTNVDMENYGVGCIQHTAAGKDHTNSHNPKPESLHELPS